MSTHKQRALAPSIPADSFDADVIVEKSLVIKLNESEIAQQIQIARSFPRAVDRVCKAIAAMATMDEDSAAEMIYSKPQGKNDQGEVLKVEGPSIRFAEALAQVWGNCRQSSRVIDVNKADKYVEAEAIFHDLETNMATIVRTRRGISTSKGYLYSPDMITTTGNAAASIARRNAILGGIPKAIYRAAYEKAREIVKGKAEDLPRKRMEVIAHFARIGVLPDQLLRKIGVSQESQLDLDHIVTLRGMYSALRSGEATKEELFTKEEMPALPSAAGKTAKPRTLDDIAERFDPDPVSDRAAPNAVSGAAGQDKPPEEVPSLPPSGGTPSEEDVAYKRGHNARVAGDAKNTVPKDYRGNRPLTDAWKAGWNAAHEEEQADGGSGE